jgi:ribosomal protein S18 acetylase RimI-like enzyme
MGVQIAEATNTSPELVQAMVRLVPQLSRTAPPPTAEEIRAIIESPATWLLVATDDETGEIVGTLTLCVFRIPTGVRAWIEDVITDDAARGRGVGEALSRFAVDRAAELGAVSVDLTSRPSREAANRLYQRIGFKPRETNVYRYKKGS